MTADKSTRDKRADTIPVSQKEVYFAVKINA